MTSFEVKTLRAEARQLKEALAEATVENRLLKKKRDRGWGGHRIGIRHRIWHRAISPERAAKRSAKMSDMAAQSNQRLTEYYA